MTIWKAKTKDGINTTENESKWSEIKDNISQLMFITDNGQTIKLPPNMEQYIQAKTASAELGNNFVNIESRYIGFKLGNNIIKVRIDEKTDNISVEIN